MSLVKGSRYLLKHANCVDDGLPLINWFLNCSENDVTFKCFNVQKVFIFYLILLFCCCCYLKQSVGDRGIKMHFKNVGIQTDLEWELTPCVQLSLCTVKASQQKNFAPMSWHRRRVTGDVPAFSWTDFCHHQNQKGKICLVDLTVLPLQYYYPGGFFALYTWGRWFREPQLKIS